MSAIEALQHLTAAIQDVQTEWIEIAKIIARQYYWEQLTIRAKVKASSATVMAMASHPMGGLAVWAALNGQHAAIEEVKRCQAQLDEINKQIEGVSVDALKLAEQVTLNQRTQDHKTVMVPVKYGNPAPGREDSHSIQRRVPMRLVYWICVVCGKEHYEARYPNKIPVYCPPTPEEQAEGLISECQRKGLYEKIHKYNVRERLKEDAQRRREIEENKRQ